MTSNISQRENGWPWYFRLPIFSGLILHFFDFLAKTRGFFTTECQHQHSYHSQRMNTHTLIWGNYLMINLILSVIFNESLSCLWLGRKHWYTLHGAGIFSLHLPMKFQPKCRCLKYTNLHGFLLAHAEPPPHPITGTLNRWSIHWSNSCAAGVRCASNLSVSHKSTDVGKPFPTIDPLRKMWLMTYDLGDQQLQHSPLWSEKKPESNIKMRPIL